MDFLKLHWVNIDFIESYWLLLGSGDFQSSYLVQRRFVGFYFISRTPFNLDKILSSLTWFDLVLLGFTEFQKVLQSLTWFYQVLPSFTEYDWVLLGFTRFYWVLQSKTTRRTATRLCFV